MASSDVNIKKIRANTLASLEGFGLNKNAMEQQIADAIEQARMQAQSNKNMASVVAVSESEAVNYKSIEKDVKNYLQEVGLDKIQTNGDGNCFFYAVQGYGDIKRIPELSISVLEMREAVAQTIETKKGLYLPSFRSNAELEDHVAKIRMCEERNPKERNPYADEVDVAAFSDHFNVCIVIHDWRKTNYTPYHIRKISYPGDCDVGRHTNPTRIHILRTNENHYSLLMPIDDPEYIAIKLLVESLYLPLSSEVLGFHQQQLQQMANQAAVNLSGFQLNQPAAAAAVSGSPRPLPGNARHAAINLSGIGLSQSSRSSALNTAPFFNLSLTPEQLAQQLAILENVKKSTAQAASSSSSTSMSGKSAASAIPLNGTNMPAKAASSSSSAVPSVVQQLVSNASRNLSGVHLNNTKKSRIVSEILMLQEWIETLQGQIKKLEISDPEGKIVKKREMLAEKQAKLSKRLDILSKKGGTRKRRTLKKRRTHKKQNKNNRKSHRKVRK